MAVDVEGGEDAERVPGAVRVPPAVAVVDTVRRRDRRKRVRHSDPRAVALEHERVGVVEPQHRVADVVERERELGRDLVEPRRPAELDEAGVDVIPDEQVEVFQVLSGGSAGGR